MWARRHLLTPQGHFNVGLKRYLLRHKENGLQDIKNAIARGADVNCIGDFSVKEVIDHQTKTHVYYVKKVLKGTPLVFVIESATPEKVLDLITLLLAVGADVNNNKSYANSNTSYAYTTALIATLNNTKLPLNTTLDILGLLFKHGLKIQSRKEVEKIALFLSKLIKSKHPSSPALCDQFIEAGLQENDELLHDLMHDAIIANNEKMVSYFLKLQPANHWGTGTNSYRYEEQYVKLTPLIQAIIRDLVDIVQLFVSKNVNIDKRNEKNTLPLEAAIMQGNLPIIKLLAEEANLAQLTSTGDPLLIQALKKRDNAIVAILLKAGVNRAQTNEANETALHQAARMGNEEIMPLLLDEASEAYLNQVNHQGNTALYIAAKHHHPNIVRCLLKAGAEDLENKNGMTAELATLDYPTKKALITQREDQTVNAFLRAIQLLQPQKMILDTRKDPQKKPQLKYDMHDMLCQWTELANKTPFNKMKK